MKREDCLIESFGGMQDSDMSKTYSQGNYADGLSAAAQAEQPNSSPAIPPSAEVHTGKADGSLDSLSTHVMHNVPLVSYRKLTCLNALSSFLPSDRDRSKREQQLGDAAASSGAAAAAFQPT